MVDNQRNIDRRSALKGIGILGGSALGISQFSPIVRAESDDVSTDAVYLPPSGSYMVTETTDRSAESIFGQDQEGTSYTSAGHVVEQLTAEPEWFPKAGKYKVMMRTWAFANCGYELENGVEGTENLYRTKSHLSVDTTHSDQVSTVAHDDVEWGVAVIGRNENSDPPDATTAIADGVITLLSNMSESIGSIYTASKIYENYKNSSIDAEIDKTWHLQPHGQPSMGHYIEYTHTFPPSEELGSDTIEVNVNNRLDNSIYESYVDWTGNREPTGKYDKTTTYNLYVPESPY